MFYTCTQVNHTYQKATIAGNVVTLREYASPIIYNKPPKQYRAKSTRILSAVNKTDNRNKSIARARRTVKDLANTNFDGKNSKFLTLTFKENITDITLAWSELKNFVKRLNYHLKQPVEYISVIEFQDRGAVHFHLLINMPYTPAHVLADIWGNGFIRINKIEHVDNVGAYVTKYMVKDLDDERLVGRKCYSCSRNLKKPAYIHDTYLVEKLKTELGSLSVARMHVSTFESPYNGTVTYTQVVLKHPLDISSYVRNPLEGIFVPTTLAENEKIDNPKYVYPAQLAMRCQ